MNALQHRWTFLLVLALFLPLLATFSSSTSVTQAQTLRLQPAYPQTFPSLLPPKQQSYLKASTVAYNDGALMNVAISGDTLVVGMPLHQTDNIQYGSVFVYVRMNNTWELQTKLMASTNVSMLEIDQFGYSVAIDGDTIVVGAPYDDSTATEINGDPTNNDATDVGAAYVFVRDPQTQTWSQQAYLKAANAEDRDFFGSSVAISGDTVVVGAPIEDGGSNGVNGDPTDNSILESGAAYVFVRNGETWTQEAYIKASNPDSEDNFGSAIELNQDTLVIGTIREDSTAIGINGDQTDNSALDAGAVYVFVRDSQTPVWTQQAYLKASNTDTEDGFGGQIDLDGDTLIVGAAGEDSAATEINGDQSDNSILESGAAYVFIRNGETWTQQAYLKAQDTAMEDVFGYSVAISGDIAVVGAPRKEYLDPFSSSNVFDTGVIYIFIREGTTWSPKAITQSRYQEPFNSNSSEGDEFGNNIALDGTTIAVVAPSEDSGSTGVNGDQANNSVGNSGATFIFTLPEVTNQVFLPRLSK